MSDAILKILGLANGMPHPATGEYVIFYTPSGHGGRGKLVTTPDRDRAKRYPSLLAAMEHWRAVSRTHPVRRDGKPNRPMTAFHVSPEPADAEPRLPLSGSG